MVEAKKIFTCVLLFVCCWDYSVAQDQEFKYFYGISWRGKVHENLLYARNMGYKYVFYQKGMEEDTLSNGLFFYLESPEYSIYKRVVNTQKKYSEAEIKFYEKYGTVVNENLKFPANLATGWFFNDTSFSVELDYRKEEVITWTVKKIFESVQKIEHKNPRFKFAGFAWDVPQLTGDFWSSSSSKGNKGHRQVSLGYWNTSDEKSSSIEEKKYVKGRIQYYQTLFSEMRLSYPGAKIIMEPNRIYEDWIKLSENTDVPTSIMPDLLCQESSDWKFISDERILRKGLIKKEQLASTTPNVFGEYENRIIAGQLAVNGGWFSWFGRFGGTGDMPNYTSIADVPDRLKLIRVLVNWENLNNTPLSKRSFKNEEYKSTTAGFSKDILWGINPQSKDIFFVFLSTKGVLPLSSNNPKIKVYQLDNFMSKGEDVTSHFIISGGKLSLKDLNLLGKSFVLSY